MAGCYFSIFDFLFLCYLWGAWLQYNTDAQQGEKTSFNLLLIPNQSFYVRGVYIVKDVRPTDARFSNVPLTYLVVNKTISAYTMFLESLLIMEVKYYFLYPRCNLLGKKIRPGYHLLVMQKVKWIFEREL